VTVVAYSGLQTSSYHLWRPPDGIFLFQDTN